MNFYISKAVGVILLLALSSCSNCYKYTSTSFYLIRNGNSFYRFSPKYEYFDVDYDRLDSLLYVKHVHEKSTGKRIKYKHTEGVNFVYKVKDQNAIVISAKIGDTTKNKYCLSLIYSSFWDGSNLCGLNKYFNHYDDAPSYKYWYVKDTLIYTNKSQKDCFVAHSALVEDKNFFIKFPIKWYIEKETGIPLMVRYPYCRDEESSSSWLLRYNEITLHKEEKFLFLNKKRQLW